MEDKCVRVNFMVEQGKRWCSLELDNLGKEATFIDVKNVLDQVYGYPKEAIRCIIFGKVVTTEDEVKFVRDYNTLNINIVVKQMRLPNASDLTLHQFVWSKYVDGVKEYLGVKTNLRIINTVDDLGRTPLIISARIGSFECLHLLLSNAANIFARDITKRNVTRWAFDSGNYSLATFTGWESTIDEAVINKVYDETDKGNETAALNLLAKHGISIATEIKHSSYENCTLLILASKRGLEKVVDFLVHRDVFPDIWATDKTSKTAKKWAEENNCTNIINLLTACEHNMKSEFNAR